MLLALLGDLLVRVDEQRAPEFGSAGAFADDLAGAVAFCVFGAADDFFHLEGGRGISLSWYGVGEDLGS